MDKKREHEIYYIRARTNATDKLGLWQDLKIKEHENRIVKLEREAQPLNYFENLSKKESKELTFMVLFLIILIFISIISMTISTIK